MHAIDATLAHYVRSVAGAAEDLQKFADEMADLVAEDVGINAAALAAISDRLASLTTETAIAAQRTVAAIAHEMRKTEIDKLIDKVKTTLGAARGAA